MNSYAVLKERLYKNNSRQINERLRYLRDLKANQNRFCPENHKPYYTVFILMKLVVSFSEI